MTEAEWLTCADSQPMLRSLLGNDYPRVKDFESLLAGDGTARKLRLFACACYSRIRHLLPCPPAHAAVEVAEQAADGVVQADELQRVGDRLRELIDALEDKDKWRSGATTRPEVVELAATHAALLLARVVVVLPAHQAACSCSSNAAEQLAALANPGAASLDPAPVSSRRAEERAQAELLRCIFGSPFRPVAAEPHWLTSSAVALARAVYAERAFDRLPILADALEEAGCDDAEMLAHCRGEGPHVRGCWAVDLVLGKQ